MNYNPLDSESIATHIKISIMTYFAEPDNTTQNGEMGGEVVGVSVEKQGYWKHTVVFW